MILSSQKKISYWIIVLFFLLPLCSYAQSDSFTVRQQIGVDTTPPSTPTGLTAVPVATTQIDLSWNVSTDDFSLGGYQLFRDAVQIATTTLLTYSDSGLTPSTTYSYYVTAFDSSFNFSSSSSVIATTTLPVVIVATTTPTTTPSSSSGKTNEIKLMSFSVTPATHSAAIEWTTSRYAQFDLRWGRTSTYELGFVSSNLYKRENETVISDLQPGTIYEFQLIAHDRDGKSVVLKEGRFTTLNAPDTVAPSNVSNLRATVLGDDVQLTWDNPEDPDFLHVRIVRNYFFYPTDVYDGYPVYQDGGNSFFDAGVLEKRAVQYYTVFSYDTNGNISSGAVVPAYRRETDFQKEPSVATGTVDFSAGIEDVSIIQNKREIKPTDDSFVIDTTKPFTVRIPYDVFPEHLKAIQVTFYHPRDDQSSFSFLLRVNADKTAYEATVAPLHIVGVFPMRFYIYDFDTELLSTFDGEIIAQTEKLSVVDLLHIKSTGGNSLLPYFVTVLFILVLLSFWWLIVYRRKRSDTDKNLST